MKVFMSQYLTMPDYECYRDDGVRDYAMIDLLNHVHAALTQHGAAQWSFDQIMEEVRDAHMDDGGSEEDVPSGHMELVSSVDHFGWFRHEYSVHVLGEIFATILVIEQEISAT